MMHSSLKSHECIPYGLELWPGHGYTITLYETWSRANNSRIKRAGVVFLFPTSSMMHPSVKFHDYIAYGLGVNGWTL